jgi:hypothetical protein
MLGLLELLTLKNNFKISLRTIVKQSTPERKDNQNFSKVRYDRKLKAQHLVGSFLLQKKLYCKSLYFRLG